MNRVDTLSGSDYPDPMRVTESDRAPGAPIAIVGMHRSGTSMVARLLQEAGLYLGDEADLMPPAEENPAGFYEHLGFVRLNDEVLNAAGAGWDCPPPPGVDWNSGAFTPFRDRARRLAEPLHSAAVWGWKDPRTSLTLPFWRSAFGPLRPVVVIRNPLEVVTSLHRRNGFSIALGLTLWQTYAERILEATSPDGRIVTHFDAWFINPEQEIGRLLDALQLPNRQDTAALQAAAVPALRHHRKSVRDLEEAGFPEYAIALYGRLAHEADWWEDGAELGDDRAGMPAPRSSGAPTIGRGIGRVDLLRVENEALRRNNDDFSAALAGREARIAELETALRSHEAARLELEGQIADRESRIADRESQIADRESQIADRASMIARREQAVAVLQQQLARNASEMSRLQEQIAEQERSLAIGEIHERELRSMLTGLQAMQAGRDAEIMGTLGAVLSRYAPGAPASIYHRRLVAQVRRLVEAHVPVKSRTLVATYGDSAMLGLGDRPTQAFPRSASGIVADYTGVSEKEAVAQIEALRDDGAEFLVVPSPALPWLASHPALERHLEQRATPIARDRGVATIYALNRPHATLGA